MGDMVVPAWMVQVSGEDQKASTGVPVRWATRFLPLAVALLTGLLVVPGMFNAPRTQFRWTVRPASPLNNNNTEEEVHTEPVQSVQHGPERRFVRPGDELAAVHVSKLKFRPNLLLAKDVLGISARIFRVHGFRRERPPDPDDDMIALS